MRNTLMHLAPKCWKHRYTDTSHGLLREPFLHPRLIYQSATRIFFELDSAEVMYLFLFLISNFWLCRLRCLFDENLAILALERDENATESIPSARDVGETTNHITMR